MTKMSPKMWLHRWFAGRLVDIVEATGGRNDDENYPNKELIEIIWKNTGLKKY